MNEKRLPILEQSGCVLNVTMNHTYWFDEIFYDLDIWDKIVMLCYEKENGTYKGLFVEVHNFEYDPKEFNKDWIYRIPAIHNDFDLKPHISRYNKFVVVTKKDLIEKVIHRHSIYRKDLDRNVTRDYFNKLPIEFGDIKIREFHLLVEVLKGGLIYDFRKKVQPLEEFGTPMMTNTRIPMMVDGQMIY